MIVITGGAGFIGSAVAWKLNQLGKNNIIIVDELRSGEKWKNLVGLNYADFIHKEDFLDYLQNDNLPFEPESFIHLGACSSTTEKDADYLMDNNVKFSQAIAYYAMKNSVRFIYASSAATYGDGSNGYDDEAELASLRPLNMYGYSKHFFDQWMKRNSFDKHAVGLKYFNVYGPNEYHKGDMRSVVHKAFGQIVETGKVNLFKSYNEKYADGEQMRDFIYVKDAVDMTLYFWQHREIMGLFNVGTGKARTWKDLVTALFNAVGKPVNIEFIEMPDYLKPKYQYFTEAKMGKIGTAGFSKQHSSLEDGVSDYVKNYLIPGKHLAQ